MRKIAKCNRVGQGRERENPSVQDWESKVTWFNRAQQRAGSRARGLYLHWSLQGNQSLPLFLLHLLPLLQDKGLAGCEAGKIPPEGLLPRVTRLRSPWHWVQDVSLGYLPWG